MFKQEEMKGIVGNYSCKLQYQPALKGGARYTWINTVEMSGDQTRRAEATRDKAEVSAIHQQVSVLKSQF